jgi:hypothetical protein
VEMLDIYIYMKYIIFLAVIEEEHFQWQIDVLPAKNKS